MPPKHQTIYIKLPGSDKLGLKERYYPIDPATLSWSVLAELFRRDDRSGAIVRAYGVRPNIRLVDPADLLRQWRDLRHQLGELLPDSGLAADFAQELTATFNSLPRLIEELSQGRLSESSGALTSVCEHLMTLALAVTETARQMEARSVEPEEQAEAGSDVREELYAHTAEFLADRIDEGLSAYRVLVALDNELTALIEALEQTQNWSAHIAAGPNWLEDQLAWLGEDDGFSAIARHFLIRRDASLVDYMAAVVDGEGGVRDRLEAIAGLITEARTRHSALQDRADAALEQQYRIDALIRVMQEAREEVDKLSRSGIDPFQLVKGLITTDEFAAWQGIWSEPDWHSLLAVGHRLRDKTQLVHQLLVQEPALSPPDARVIGMVEQYVGLVEDSLRELGQATSQAPVPAPTATAAPTPAAKTRTRATALPAGVDPARLEVLYELMLAIGAVKYCDRYNLTGGTPNALFDLIEALGLMTPGERQIYNGPLRQRLMADSIAVEDTGLSRVQAWKQTDPRRYRWIRFRQPRGRGTTLYNQWRLVKQFQEQGLAICAQHNLNPDDIEAAFVARRAARQMYNKSD